MAGSNAESMYCVVNGLKHVVTLTFKGTATLSCYILIISTIQIWKQMYHYTVLFVYKYTSNELIFIKLPWNIKRRKINLAKRIMFQVFSEINTKPHCTSDKELNPWTVCIAATQTWLSRGNWGACRRALVDIKSHWAAAFFSRTEGPSPRPHCVTVALEHMHFSYCTSITAEKTQLCQNTTHIVFQLRKKQTELYHLLHYSDHLHNPK